MLVCGFVFWGGVVGRMCGRWCARRRVAGVGGSGRRVLVFGVSSD